MKGKCPNFLKLIGFSRWHEHSSYWKYLCICGNIVEFDKKRLKGSRPYKTCGCFFDQNSKTFLYYFRRQMIGRIEKKDGHWLYKSNSKQKKIIIRFRGKYYSIQRLAYMFWNHTYEINEKINIGQYCGNKNCICPSHLRILTNSEMSRLKWSKKRWSTSRKDGKNN